MSVYGSYLLSPFVPEGDGARASACPVCLAVTAVAAPGGWVGVRCEACGTDFVATDGSAPPPLPPPPPAPVVAHSPIAPTERLEPLEPAQRARGFTSDIRTTADGRRLVTCPQCRHAEIEVARRATIAEVVRCPKCRGTFLVGLGTVSGGR